MTNLTDDEAIQASSTNQTESREDIHLLFQSMYYDSDGRIKIKSQKNLSECYIGNFRTFVQLIYSCSCFYTSENSPKEPNGEINVENTRKEHIQMFIDLAHSMLKNNETKVVATSKFFLGAAICITYFWEVPSSRLILIRHWINVIDNVESRSIKSRDYFDQKYLYCWTISSVANICMQKHAETFRKTKKGQNR
jgi:hypothetical protein